MRRNIVLSSRILFSTTRNPVIVKTSLAAPANTHLSRHFSVGRCDQKDEMMSNPGGRMIFRQLFEKVSCTFTYILGCPTSKEAFILDPVIETVQRDINLLSQLGLKLKYAANTHVHADHVTGSGLIKKELANVQSVIAAVSGAQADLLVNHGDVLRVGSLELEVRSTPGHTDGCLTYVMHNQRSAFTGDSLLIRGCGRTDFQQGNAGMLYDSVHREILSLPSDYALYPAHDYNGLTATSVEEELKHNRRLTKSRKEFVEIMDGLGLAYPQQIDKSLPANLVCGIVDRMDQKTAQLVNESLEAYR